jgi:hypothetical protein
MATNYKVLGQISPSAASATTLYTVPAATEAVISCLVVANISTSTLSYRIAVRPDGAALENKHYLAYDTVIAPNTSTVYNIALCLDAGDVVTVYESGADLSFSAYGSEIA